MADETTPTEPENGNGDEETPAEGGEGAEETPAPAPDVPEDLGTVEEASLRELHGQVVAAAEAMRDTVKTPDAIAEYKKLRDTANRIAGEIEKRRRDEAEVAAELQSLDEQPLADLPAQDADPKELVGAGASAAQLASARAGQSASEQAPPPSQPARPRVAMLAAAGNDRLPSGTEVTDEMLGQAIDSARRGPDGRAVLASLPAWDDLYRDNPDAIPEPLSEDNSASRNTMLIHEAVEDWRNRIAGRQAAARQGAICDPLDIIREIPDAFSTDTPVADLFPSRPMSRLGFQYIPSMDLSTLANAVTVWDEADQAAVVVATEATWKPCVDVVCPSVTSIRAEAITACIRYDITTEMSNPERIGNANNALRAVRARTKDGRLLERIDQLSVHYRAAAIDYGALPAVIEVINTITSQLRYAQRLEDQQYTLILPPPVPHILTIDRANRAYGVEQEVQDVLAYLNDSLLDVNRVVVTQDASLGGEPGLPFPALPSVNNVPFTSMPYIEGGDYRLRLVAPEAAIYGDTGEMNAGVMRDSNQIRQNKAQYFTEEFIMLAKHGPQPWATVDMILCADGSRAGLITPDACATS